MITWYFDFLFPFINLVINGQFLTGENWFQFLTMLNSNILVPLFIVEVLSAS